MELNKKLIHLEKEYPSISSEFVMEEDLIIPDTKPDIAKILLYKNELVISETRVQEQKINVNGVFHFAVLYSPENNPAALNSLHGEIPFDEQIQMDGITASDTIHVTAETEDMSLRIINSRKCNLHALISISAVKTQLYDAHLPVPFDAEDNNCSCDNFLTRTRRIEYLELNTLKKDICRIREDINLPDNFPNVETMLWNTLSISDLEIVPAAGKLSLSCNLQIFFIYEGEGEEHPIRYYETTIPFTSSLECSGSEPGLIPNIVCQPSHSSAEVRSNADGEPRCISIEQTLDLNIRLYRENSTVIIDDIYHCRKECSLLRKETILPSLCERNSTKQLIQGTYQIPVPAGSILQLIYPCSQLTTQQPKITDSGIEICGILQVQSLYLRNDDDIPYDSFTSNIPFCHRIEIDGICKHAMAGVMISLDKVSITSSNNNDTEVKATINYEILVTIPCTENLITEITCSDFAPEKLDCIPGIIIYYVKPGDTLWQLAKTYYVSEDSIREDNELSSDVLSPGQQLLIVR